MTTHSIAYRGHGVVALAAMHKDYVPLFAEHANTLEVTEGITLRPPISLESEFDWYDSLAARKAAGTDEVFAVLVRNSTTDSALYEFAGTTGLHGINWPDRRGTTGSWLFRKDQLDKKYGTEAKLLLQYHAFRIKGLRKLTSNVKAFNSRSVGHLLKCGYSICGRHRAHHLHDGTYVDEFMLEVFREEWEPIWERYQETKELPKLTEAQRALVEKETK